MPGKHFVEHDTQAVDVRPGIDFAGISGLFRRHIRRGPEYGRCHRDHRILFVGRFGDAQVGKLCGTVRREHDVVGFDVPVDHVMGTGRRKGVRDLRNDPQRLVGRNPVRFLQKVPHAPARDIVHDDVVLAVFGVLSGVVDGDQVRMPDLAGELRLPDETVDELFVLGCDVGGQDLQREKRVKHIVPHKIYGPHAPLPQLFYDRVFFEDRPRFQVVVFVTLIAFEPFHFELAGFPLRVVLCFTPYLFRVGSLMESSQSALFMPWRISSGYRLTSFPVLA